MRRLFFRRLLMLPLVMLGVTFLLFLLTQTLSPQMRASLYIQEERQMHSLEEVIQKYGLRDNVFKQYGRWAQNALRGDLGYSQSANMPVSSAIKEYMPATFELAVVTIMLTAFFGIWFGCLSARNKGKITDIFLRFVSISGFSIPIFVLGLVLLLIFYAKLGWFGPGRMSIGTDILVGSPYFKQYTHLLLVDTLLNLKFKAFFDVLAHLILPAATLCIGSFALLMRVMRSSMLEELSKDYVRTARAKGLSEFYVVYKHAAKNALIPVVTLASVQFIRLLGGTVIVESIFNFPGIGRFGVMCAQQLDIAGVLGFSLMIAFLFVLGNLVADLIYMFLDPRVRI